LVVEVLLLVQLCQQFVHLGAVGRAVAQTARYPFTHFRFDPVHLHEVCPVRHFDVKVAWAVKIWEIHTLADGWTGRISESQEHLHNQADLKEIGLPAKLAGRFVAMLGPIGAARDPVPFLTELLLIISDGTTRRCNKIPLCWPSSSPHGCWIAPPDLSCKAPGEAKVVELEGGKVSVVVVWRAVI